MHKQHATILLSATDLANHLGCPHLTCLNYQVAEGRLKTECYFDPTLELLQELGQRHEQKYLSHLRDSGKTVVELNEFDGRAGADKTWEAIHAGIDVIAQAQLEKLPWRGRADFLLKTDLPSRLGPWSYQVADTKLTQTTRASTVLQLCLYCDLLAEIQGRMPEVMLVVKPGDPFATEALRTADFMAYYRRAKQRFEEFVAAPPIHGYPQPVAQCEICNWWPRCQQVWRNDDHLTFVAGISKSQIVELAEHDIRTLEAFADPSCRADHRSNGALSQTEFHRSASADSQANTPAGAGGTSESAPATFWKPKRGSIASLVKSHLQARIQLKGRRTGQRQFEFQKLEDGRGFRRLPARDPADVFFDIEGHPRAIGEPLEYLLGHAFYEAGALLYRNLWGLTAKDEKRAFEQFMDFVMQRWDENPGMHIYHFAPYEPSALKRLAAKHATRENELDRLLRGRRMVDLFGVVRQGIRASVEGYSIKQLEPFYGYERAEALHDARKALREVERLLELDMMSELTTQHRSVVESYNKDDCLSTAALRDWLEQLRQQLIDQGQAVPRPELGEGDASEQVEQRDAKSAALFARLTADIDGQPVGDDQQARWLLAHLLDYFRREAKCDWWEYFRLQELEPDELLTDRNALYGLQFEGEVPKLERERTPTHRYRFDTQEVSIDVGATLHEVPGDVIGTVRAIDPIAGILDVKKRGTARDRHPLAVMAFDHVSATTLSDSVFEFAITVAEVCEHDQPMESARYDLVCKRAPRLRTLQLPVQRVDVETASRLALDMDHSVLAIQGPPGSGKTFLGGHMICALARAGQRVGVTAVSHKVITNLLESVKERAIERGEQQNVAQKTDAEDLPDHIQRLESNEEALDAVDHGTVVGGTAWLWSRREADQRLDYLFVDEAGQMSLAMALAASRAADNIVLLGDPRQLEQPQRGQHPENSGVAALDHLLDGHPTMPPAKGLFLEDTWRLHPAICSFTSEQFYENRLKCCDGLQFQEVFGESAYTGSGLLHVPVEHANNANRSPEEVAVINRIVRRLLDGRHQWSNHKAELAPITVDQILIVAPYNAQVAALRDGLPAGCRVGTVDKFQGQEAAVLIYSLTSSSIEDAPRGAGFLLSPNRLNVATSRARCLVILVGSPSLLEADCHSVEQLRQLNRICRYLELASVPS